MGLKKRKKEITPPGVVLHGEHADAEPGDHSREDTSELAE